jgi:bifunctional non-homologous end joining protein LigD
MASEETHVEVDGEPVRISSPSKLMFPVQGWTKLDLVQHYLTVWPGALRGVYGRPTVLKRFNDGVGSEPVFQKRVRPRDERQELATIRFPSGRTANLLVPRHASDVVWLAQQNCVDLNPWAVRAEDLDRPDELRIDLDPTPEVTFGDVRDIAQTVADVLEEHDLVGWPKTSGNRGIHVYARIVPEWSFTEVRRAALALGREVERRAPDVATTAWWKEERRGVFLDYNQNARDRTIASAYSVRHTGRVSAPLRWDEVPTVEHDAFPMDAFAQRWESVGDLTEGMDEAAGRLDGLLELAAQDEAGGLGDAPWPPHFPKQEGEPTRAQPSRRRDG